MRDSHLFSVIWFPIPLPRSSPLYPGLQNPIQPISRWRVHLFLFFRTDSFWRPCTFLQMANHGRTSITFYQQLISAIGMSELSMVRTVSRAMRSIRLALLLVSTHYTKTDKRDSTADNSHLSITCHSPIMTEENNLVGSFPKGMDIICTHRHLVFNLSTYM